MTAELEVHDLALKGPRGWVYQGVSFEASRGVVALAGPRGSGRTSLLLTLAGRMRPGAGTAVVFGQELPRRAARVRRLSALGPVPGVNDLEQSLSVAEHLRERRWLHRGTRRPADVLAEVGLTELQPRTLVRDLDELDAFRLGTALALLGRPRLLAVDDVPDRPEAWQLLHAVADRPDGPLVLAATLAVPGLPAETLVTLQEPARA